MRYKVFGYGPVGPDMELHLVEIHRGGSGVVVNGNFVVKSNDNWDTCYFQDGEWKSVSQFVMDLPDDHPYLRGDYNATLEQVKKDLVSHTVMPKFLVARWDVTDSAAFQELGHREELALSMRRLADDIAAYGAHRPSSFDAIALHDTNGLRIGVASFVFADTSGGVSEAKPQLLLPVKDWDLLADMVKGVASQVHTFVEDIQFATLRGNNETAIVEFQWRELPSLERGQTLSHAQIIEASKIHVAMEEWDAVFHGSMCNVFADIASFADELGMSAALLGFDDGAHHKSVRVGYLKAGKLTGIASEIYPNGVVLTTVNGLRNEGTGFTSDGEWRREQLRGAFAAAAHIWSETLSDETNKTTEATPELGGL